MGRCSGSPLFFTLHRVYIPLGIGVDAAVILCGDRGVSCDTLGIRVDAATRQQYVL